MITVFVLILKYGLKETASIMEAENVKTNWFIVDVSDERNVEAAAARVRNEIGDVDILINNAGIAPCEPFKEFENSKVTRVFNVNVLSHFWVYFYLL